MSDSKIISLNERKIVKLIESYGVSLSEKERESLAKWVKEHDEIVVELLTKKG